MGYLFALISTAFWSVNLVLARALNQAIDPISLAFLRWLVAVLVFTPFALPTVIRNLRTIRRNLPYLLVTGLFGVSLFNTLVYFAGRSTEAINLSLITMTFPIFVLLLSRVFLREPVGIVRAVGVAVVFAGLLLLVSDGNIEVLLSLSFTPGDLLVLVASLVFATYSMLVRRRPPELGPIAFQYATFVFGLLFLLPVFVAVRLAGPPLVLTPGIVAAILYVGVCASLLAFFTWNRAIALLGPGRASVMYYTLPIFSGILAWLVLGEVFGVLHLVSLILIVTGILMATRVPVRRKVAVDGRPG